MIIRRQFVPRPTPMSAMPRPSPLGAKIQPQTPVNPNIQKPQVVHHEAPAKDLKPERQSNSVKLLKGMTMPGMLSPVQDIEVLPGNLRRVIGANGQSRIMSQGQLKQIVDGVISRQQSAFAVKSIKPVVGQKGKVQFTLGGAKKGKVHTAPNRTVAVSQISNYYSNIPRNLPANSPFRNR